MDYTLADFYQYNQVPGLLLLTRQTDFSKIRIESACFQEIPTDDFIRPNELVLSTAAGCNVNPEFYMQMVHWAINHHAAALLYTLRDKSYAIPDCAVACAESLGLPIFTMPWEYRLSDVHAFVVQQIQEKKLETFRSVQNALFNLFFQSQSLDQAAEQISSAFSIPAAVLDRLGQVKGESSLLPRKDASCEKLEIQINGELSGWLCLYEPEDCRELHAERETLEKYLVSPLSLWFYRRNLEDLAVMKIKNNFVWDLAEGNYSSMDEMSRQGRMLHFDISCSYTCALLQVAAQGSRSRVEEYSDETARNITAIERIILELGREMKLRLMVADRNLLFIIYVENVPEDSGRTAESFFNTVEDRLSQEFPALIFYWGISETTLKTPDFSHLYHNASLALQYCTSGKSESRRFTFKDTQEFRIISILAEHLEIRKTSKEVIGKLMEHNGNARMDLMATLTEYIKSNYNTSLTARNLHIHRQSLLYRLEKIETLTGLSLTNHKDLFLLEVYSRIFSDF